MDDDGTTGCTSVNVALNQATEIHAKVLAHGFGDRAPLLAQEKAHHCWASGDIEGHAVWLRVAAVAEMLLKVKNQRYQLCPRCVGDRQTAFLCRGRVRHEIVGSSRTGLAQKQSG
jgi:hypothetical protein